MSAPTAVKALKCKYLTGNSLTSDLKTKLLSAIQTDLACPKTIVNTHCTLQSITKIGLPSGFIIYPYIKFYTLNSCLTLLS